MRKSYPASRLVLNNLVYSLALRKETLPRARELLHELLEMWGDALPVHDTGPHSYTSAGDMKKAREYIAKAVGLAETADGELRKLNPAAVDVDRYLLKREASLVSETDEPHPTKLATDIGTLSAQLKHLILDKQQKQPASQ